MPCMDGGQAAYEDARDRAFLGQSLCYACSRMERGDAWEDILRENPALANWWAEHKVEDDRRETERKASAHRAQIRSAAIAKLTPQERAALGLNRDI